MKHITLFLAIFVFYTGYTQDPQLFENDWYLQNVIIDGQDNFPPSNDDVPFITITFIQNNSFISTYVCDALEGTVIYTNSEFLVDSWSMTLGGCFGPFAQENVLFQGIYLDTFFVGNIDDPFNYNIIDEGSSKTLVITASSGDKAIYGNRLLSSGNFGVSVFSIYPNPTSDMVYVEASSRIEKVAVFDLLGRKVLETVPQSEKAELNFNALKAGVYMAVISCEGKKTIKKIVKE